MKAIFPKIKTILLPQARFVPIIVILVGTALFLVSHPVWAGLEAVLANYLILPVAKFFGSLTVTLIGILISVAQYNNFIDVPAVQKGWILLRDVTNMFFIVILLLIAFGTLFRWENYHYKKLLGKLLIMAVLVNFSKGITGFMIDFAQVLMLTFVNGFADAAAGNFVQGFHLDKMFQFASNRLTPEEARTLRADETSFLIAALLALISIFVAMVVIGVIVVVLIFRIVALWFLVITSPIAYTLNIFPGQGQKYAQMWWDYFGRYAATGPILAFFLWLSLSVMQITAGQTFIETKSDPSGFGITDVPAASITGIGQSDILLSFIVNISLLIGALWMTKQMGVAGGGIAGSAMGYLQKGGGSIIKAPFKALGGVVKLSGKGAKAYGGYLYEEGTSRLGIQGLKENWKKGWAAGKEKRREARQTRLEAIYAKRKESGSVLQVLGSPEHLFEHQWNWKTLSKVATFRMGQVTGASTRKLDARAAEKDQEAERLENMLGQNKADIYRRDLKEDLTTKSKQVGDLIKEKRVLEKETTPIIGDKNKEAVELEKEAGVLEEEAVGLKADKKFKQSENKNRQADKKRQQARAIRDEVGKIERDKNRLVDDFDKKISMHMSGIRGLQDELARPDAELEERYSVNLENVAAGKLQEAEELETGGLSTEQKNKRDSQIDLLTKSLVQLTKEIAQKRAQGLDIASDLNYETQLKHQMADLKDPRTGDYTPASDQERKQNEDKIKKLRSDATAITEDAARPIQTEAERGVIRSKIEEIKAEAKRLHDEASKYRPATDYSIRRNQRLAINEEKKKMTTDNWQELARIIKDAVHAGDSNRAAAAYIKATEYGNENEIQNTFGYDSDAGGMKKLFEEVFIKQLGMAREQALSIANDASYTAEKVNHWGTARAVIVKDGKLAWHDEDDRVKEVLAEVRKKDFERFAREGNRLAWGNEVVGLHDLPENATAEEKAEYFERTGNRDFKLNDFGKAFFMEKWRDFDDLLSKKRFNINLAVKLMTGDNLEQLRKLATEHQYVTASELPEFERILKKIANFAGTEGRGEFSDIEEIIGLRKKGRL